MDDRQAFYSVIQYLPVPERFEFLNIGIALFVQSAGHVEVKIDPDYNRIKKLYGQADRQRIKWLSDSLQARLRTEYSEGWNISELSRFAAMRSGGLQMSQPLPVMVESDPKVTLEALFDELVGKSRARRQSQRATSIFRQRLLNAGVLDLVDQSPAPVDLPEGFTIKVPFAYQNGAYNLIDPIRLEGSPEEALKNASSRAVEGRWLWRHSNGAKRLVVVGDLSRQPEKFASSLHEVMRENDVGFYELDDIEPLVDDIRSHRSEAPAGTAHI